MAPLTARQSELADAALRILGRDGMAAVSFRAVATESGWSLGAVQKAFASKADLDAAVLQRLRESSVTMPPGEPGRPTLQGWLVELALAVLPLDPARREATLRGAAFADRAAFDESIGRTLAEGDATIRGLVARLVSRAGAEGEVPAELDPDRVAWAFLALVTGAATQLLYDPAQEDDVRVRVDAAVRGLLSR